jgi:hypothetical protein
MITTKGTMDTSQTSLCALCVHCGFSTLEFCS